MECISSLSKADLLVVLESVPQSYWPPRPTRQDKKVLVECIRSAHLSHKRIRDALSLAWARARIT